MPENRRYAVGLGVLAFAFFLRVLGQALVAIFAVRFLPPMEQWYSGLIPYPVLLPVQILILAVQFCILRDLWHDSGFFAALHLRIGTVLCWFSYLYFVSMLVRYVVTMTLYTERRWFDGTIPIFFHFVLAGYLYLLGRYYRGRSG